MTKDKGSTFATVLGIIIVFALWLVGAVLSLGLTAVIIWAIYELVVNFVIN